MSDFLSHLVAKSLDATDVLRPRSPSLFEPTKESGGLLSNEQLQSEQAEPFVPELTVPDRLEDTETLEPGARRPETRTPAMDDRSELRHQPLDQFTASRINHVVGLKRRKTQDPETRVDSNRAAPASSGANAPHGNLECALERITRLFDPTSDSPALGAQRLTRLPEPISRGSEEQLAPKNALHITLRPRISPTAERKDDEAVMPQILGEPVRQSAPEFGTKSILVEPTGSTVIEQRNRRHSGQESEATANRNPAAILNRGVRGNDDGRPTIAEPMPVARVESELAPVQPARVSTPAVVRPQVTRHVERFTQVPDAYPRVTAETVPTIQVTIGRIEVRATPAPIEHAKKPRSAPSVMTLDEYLRNRGKGEGR